MRSPYNPLSDDVASWAYGAPAYEPVQDWDLILRDMPYESLYMKLASSEDCPKREYFLSLLYLISGDAVRTGYRTTTQEALERLLALAEANFPSYWLRLWVQRSRELIAKPETFRYDDWCGGILARTYER